MRLRVGMRIAMATAAVASAFAMARFDVRAQVVPPVAPAVGQLPDPVYWKHDLFLVPYQWGSAAEPASAQAVYLFVSKDRGVSWQKISEARPQVKAFNYRAEGDGEYWFAVRTLDQQGRIWPAEVYRPELRVIVDTMMPQIVELRARLLDSGAIEIVWRAADQHLDAATWTIEAQVDVAGNWQPVPANSLLAVAPNSTVSSTVADTFTGHALWQPPAGVRPIALRATVLDRAGNSASYQAQVAVAPGVVVTPAQPTGAGVPSAPALTPLPSVAPTTTTPEWTSNSTPTTQASPATPVNQPWPAAGANHSQFRLWSTPVSPPTDGVTAYGDLPTSSPSLSSASGDTDVADHRLDARFAGPVTPSGIPAESISAARAADGSPVVQGSLAPTVPVTPLQPFRQASIVRLPSVGGSAAALTTPSPADVPVTQHTPPVQPKLVGSRTFALEYDLEDTGRWGVSKVELWGTRDGGRTWRSFARDDDHRSPLVVTVDEEGLYGFCIVVESAGSAAPDPPSPGDAPELWVAVDMDRPVVALTGVDRGTGNMSDHLILRWDANDDNLESKPIALFYSSRPAGPWSAIATNLEDTGEYAWRVERHVPARFYLRVEARDTAGNLAAFQTREPVSFDPLNPAGRLRDAQAVGSTAAGQLLP